ncbi:uncharacterized protein LOC126842145 [Adelges cooleyi]|uniref:uncharacterized protein LOC126842145 n=1 Tax=Adelges cooleyi TaxID=133065 RepID=UPI00218034AA|nr:uncharacterized protein LOC126842145 [Adelges cooleyi]
MTTHNYVFLSLYIILAVNIMVIESTSKVAPTYYVNQTFTVSFVNTVNKLITYNQHEIKFSDRERTILTTPINTYNDTKGRNGVFDKFARKIQDIKCTCSVIVKTKLAYLSNILDGLRSGGAIEVAMDKLNILKQEAGLLVLMFQRGQVKAGKWFWSYLLKILAIIEFESNNNFLGRTPFDDQDELQSGITDFIQYCKDKKYLPKNRTERELVSTNSQVPVNIFRELGSSVTIAVGYVNVILDMSIDCLYLKPLWDEHEFLFSQITGSVVEWRPTIRRHAVEVDKTKEYIVNRQWISRPFGHVGYHELIKRIINARAYIFLWVMLVAFDKKMPNMDENTFSTVYKETIDTVNTVFEFMEYTDTFFYDIVTQYCWTMPQDTNFGHLIDRISTRAKDSLVELNGRNPNGSDWISVNVHDELSNDAMMAFLKEFADNFYQLKAKLGSFDYALAMSFLTEAY